MNKLKRTLRGIANMPKASVNVLSCCVRACCAMIGAAILIQVAVQSGTYNPFELLQKADVLTRLSPAVLAYGVIRSLSCAVQYKQ